MIVLSRKVSEILDLTLPSGEVIEIMVVRAGPNVVRIGVTCPDEVRVDRREVTLRRAADMQPRPAGVTK